MNETIEFDAKESWVKIVDYLHQNWAIMIEREAEVMGCFFEDGSSVFDSMNFSTREAAEAALI